VGTTPANPFPIQGYFGPHYFCDRDKEKWDLMNAVRHGRNVTLFAPRRIGKTGLIRHVFHHLPKWNCLYLDVQEATTFREFVNLFLASVLNGIARRQSFLKQFQQWLFSMRPIVSTNPHTGSFEVEVDFKSDLQQRTTVKEALQLLDGFGPCVIALDEFQQLHSWSVDHMGVEGWLRSEIQTLKAVRFIFSGSQWHILSEMFQSPKRPFYASTQSMNIGKIDAQVYSTFIHSHFKAHRIRINASAIDFILDWADGNTYNIQLLCNRVFAKAQREVTLPLIDEAIVEIYEENKLSYYALRNSMTKSQWMVLSAIATEGLVFSPTSRAFIRKYNLGSGPSVLRALEYLVKRELVYQYLTEVGESYYQVYDLILMRWLQKK
jgi:uncharacterized protein